MANYRLNMVSEEVKKIIDKIIREDMHDPRIKGTYAVTRADVTRDYRHAKIYVSVLEEEYAEAFIDSLQKAAGFIRNELGHRIKLRYIPELHFVIDKNIEYGIYMSKRIDEVVKEQGDKREDD
ncbi:MAG: 30S ribosome-binding factor RbfA [Eubacteriales bacterium]|nr:30S ribosome-binding factor RbfA [Eubacteriales bacterium]